MMTDYVPQEVRGKQVMAGWHQGDRSANVGVRHLLHDRRALLAGYRKPDAYCDWFAVW
ncbi:hypothetical protein [Rhodopirellula europaea]|uniref:hypothetical protein n=1 Tax=Rhodopirellula europaea TaxID=1263866 RepID=UPI003D2E6C16